MWFNLTSRLLPLLSPENPQHQVSLLLRSEDQLTQTAQRGQVLLLPGREDVVEHGGHLSPGDQGEKVRDEPPGRLVGVVCRGQRLVAGGQLAPGVARLRAGGDEIAQLPEVVLVHHGGGGASASGFPPSLNEALLPPSPCLPRRVHSPFAQELHLGTRDDAGARRKVPPPPGAPTCFNRFAALFLSLRAACII